MIQRPRQAATPFSISARMKDAQLSGLRDRRRSDGHRIHSLPSVIGSVTLGLACNLTAFRDVESMMSVWSSTVRRMFGIRGRISDTTMAEGLESASPRQLHDCLVRMNLAEHRRGNLQPARNLPGSVVALHGKHQATLSHHDLQLAARKVLQDSERPLDSDDIERVVAGAFPDVQVCRHDDGRRYGLFRYHRVTLTSPPGHPCLLLEPIPGRINEIGQAPDTIRRRLREYQHSTLIDIITADAGNTSSDVARLIAAVNKR